MCMSIHVCICIILVPGALRGEKRAQNSPGTGAQLVVRCYVSTGN